jgi:hypothetical protein
MYAKSSKARRQYPKRLKMLFDYLKLSGPLDDQSKEFLDRMSNVAFNIGIRDMCMNKIIWTGDSCTARYSIPVNIRQLGIFNLTNLPIIPLLSGFNFQMIMKIIFINYITIRFDNQNQSMIFLLDFRSSEGIVM